MSILDHQRRRLEPLPAPGDDGDARPDFEPYFAEPQASGEFHAETLSSEGVHRVVLRGELDLTGAPLLWRRIREACAEPTRALRLDLRRLTFMDSSGLHVVLDAHELCAHGGYDFAIIGATAPVRRLFEVSGLAGLLLRQRP
jgi:anti-anti-sigma factor